jgi:putative endonuclease
MYYAYVIRSVDFDFLYKGHCADLETRLKQHNYRMTKSIKKYAPFVIAYSESFETLPEAIKREKYFKTAAGRRFLKSMLGIQVP